MADDEMGAKPAGDVKAILEEVLSTGKPTADRVLSALKAAGIQVIGPGDAPLMGDGQDETGIRPERNPPENTDGMSMQALGEPMNIDQIGQELFESEMGGAPAPAT